VTGSICAFAATSLNPSRIQKYSKIVAFVCVCAVCFIYEAFRDSSLFSNLFWVGEEEEISLARWGICDLNVKGMWKKKEELKKSLRFWDIFA